MKNTIKTKAICKMAGIIALLAVIGFSMAACGDGSGGGGADSGSYTFTLKSIDFVCVSWGNSADPYSYVTFDFNTSGSISWKSSAYDRDGINSEFTLTIDGNAVEISSLHHYTPDSIQFGIGPIYENGKTYKIKLVYKASSASNLVLYVSGEPKSINSFTVEQDVIYKK